MPGSFGCVVSVAAMLVAVAASGCILQGVGTGAAALEAPEMATGPAPTMDGGAGGAPSLFGPGSVIRTDVPGQGESQCTASFVFEDRDGAHYIATAGHCLLPFDVKDSLDPDFEQPRVEVCVGGCLHPLTADLVPVATAWADLGPVLFAQRERNGEMFGEDFGFVEIPVELLPSLRTGVGLGGPSGLVSTGPPFGTDVLYYVQQLGAEPIEPTLADAGASRSCHQEFTCVPANVPHPGVAGFPTDRGFRIYASAVFGDSGVPVLYDAEEIVNDGAAAGPLGIGWMTHIVIDSVNGVFHGTLATEATAVTSARIGVDLTLIPAPDP